MKKNIILMTLILLSITLYANNYQEWFENAKSASIKSKRYLPKNFINESFAGKAGEEKVHTKMTFELQPYENEISLKFIDGFRGDETLTTEDKEVQEIMKKDFTEKIDDPTFFESITITAEPYPETYNNQEMICFPYKKLDHDKDGKERNQIGKIYFSQETKMPLYNVFSFNPLPDKKIKKMDIVSTYKYQDGLLLVDTIKTTILIKVMFMKIEVEANQYLKDYFLFEQK